MDRYIGTMLAIKHDAPRRWPRLTHAIARYIAGPHPVAEDMDDAADTIAQYKLMRSLEFSQPRPCGDTQALKRAIRNAIAAR